MVLGCSQQKIEQPNFLKPTLHLSYLTMHLQKSIYIRSVAEMQTVSISSTSFECSACTLIMINVNVEYVRTMFLSIATKEIDFEMQLARVEHTQSYQTIIER
jgi:hypothetical protein